MFKDKRGRVRFTVKGVRYEINKEGVLRTYRRDGNRERKAGARPVNVNYLYGESWKLHNALMCHLYGGTW
jgi:hypothetical protein